MNQSYSQAVRGSVFGPGQSELRPHNGHVSTSYGNQCGIGKRGSEQLSSSSLKPPSSLGYNQPERTLCYSPQRRLQDLNTVVNRSVLDRDVPPSSYLHCVSPNSDDDDDEFEAPSVQLPPSPGNNSIQPYETLEGVSRNGFSPRSPDSLLGCSPIPNGYLHFESKLFYSSDLKEEDEEGGHSGSEDSKPFLHSQKLCQERNVTDGMTSCENVADRKTYKPTVFNLMSKTISELNPTLSPSALPEINIRDSWNVDEDSASDYELTSPVDPGLISPSGTNSNVSYLINQRTFIHDSSSRTFILLCQAGSKVIETETKTSVLNRKSLNWPCPDRS